MRHRSNSVGTMLRKRVGSGETKIVIPSVAGWSMPLRSSHREAAIETAIFGIAIGESLGLRFNGLSAAAAGRKAKKAQGKKLASVFSRRHDLATVVAISVGQSLLCSTSSPQRFGASLLGRMRGHQVARMGQFLIERIFPFGLPMNKAARQGRVGSIDRLLPCVVLLTAAVQGTTNRISPWLKELFSAGGCDDELLVGFARLLARASQYAVFNDTASFDPVAVLAWLKECTHDEEVLEWLGLLESSFSKKESLEIFAGRLNEKFPDESISGDPRFVIFVSIYAWLLHSHDWPGGLLEVVSLGGAAAAQAAIFSALTALLDNGECLPASVVQRHRWFPVGSDWLDAWVTRLLQWPHGADDLVNAHALRRSELAMLAMHKVMTIRSFGRQIRAILS